MLASTMIEAGHQRYRTPTDLLIFFFMVLGVYFLRGAWSVLRNKHVGL
jgi:hypothetical protein